MKPYAALGVCIFFFWSAGEAGQETFNTEWFRMLRQNLGDQDRSVRYDGIQRLQQISEDLRSSIPYLVRIVEKDSDAGARARAAQTLAVIASMGATEIHSGAKPVLIKALEDPQDDVKKSALLALINMRPMSRDAVPKMIPFIKHRRIDIRITAINGITLFAADAADAVPLLIEAVRDPAVASNGITVSECAVRSLAAFGPAAKDAAPVFQEMFAGQDRAKKHFAVFALARIGAAEKEHADYLAAALNDPLQKAWHLNVLDNLGVMGKKAESAIPALLVRWEDNEVPFGQAELVKLNARRVAIIRVFGEIGVSDEKVMKVVSAARSDADTAVRQQAEITWKKLSKVDSR